MQQVSMVWMNRLVPAAALLAGAANGDGATGRFRRSMAPHQRRHRSDPTSSGTSSSHFFETASSRPRSASSFSRPGGIQVLPFTTEPPSIPMTPRACTSSPAISCGLR